MHASGPRVGIAGATGAVGREMIDLIVERSFDVGELRLLASARSAGTAIDVNGRPHDVVELTDESLRDLDLVFFSAGGSISRRFAPTAVAAGAHVVDNSSAFRMDPGVPLVVPEINGALLDGVSGATMVANPNCSTIIALMAVTPLHRAVGVERMVVSTYQAVSGAGAAMMAELEQQARDFATGAPLTTGVSGRQLLFNVFSHDSAVGDDGQNEEEVKLIRETRRIWDDPEVKIAATCVRVGVLRAHAESITLTFRAPLAEPAARRLLDAAPGITIVDDRAAGRFPEPIHASGLDDVLIGRIRADPSQPAGMGLMMFVCGDQLRKGAALNAIQIAERLLGVTATAR